MGPLTINHHGPRDADALPLPLPSPTLTNPEMILPFSRADTPTSDSPPSSPPMFSHSLQHAASARTLVAQSSSSPLSHSPASWAPGTARAQSITLSSVHSDELESLNWSKFDGVAGVESEADDEERFGSFPQVAGSSSDDEDIDRWDTPQSDAADDSAYTSAALSRRADIILANAKKRLSLMEGNLRGARSSLVNPTGALSLSALRSPVYQERKASSAMGFTSPRRLYQPYPPTSHSRMSSDSDVPDQPVQSTPRTGPKRASSAMAFTLSATPGDRRFALRESRSQEQILLKRWNSVNDRGFFPGTPESRGSSSDLDSVPENRPVTAGGRSLYGATTTDLREQMNDLKGRISKLQQRAREDGMKRRSFQSLQAPSPFTSAPDVDYDDVKSSSPWPANTPVKTPAQPTRAAPIAPDQESHYEDAAEHRSGGGSSDEAEAIINDYESSVEGESVYEDANYDPKVPERHEDRADAFDYETFFLHSAMGTIRRGRRGSVSSNDSVETTRPVSPSRIEPEPTQSHDPGLHKRMPSVESISTQASFVTAAEDDDDRDAKRDTLDRLDSALGNTWPMSAFMRSSPTLGGESARNSVQPQPSSSLGDIQIETSANLDQTDKTLITSVQEGLRNVCEQLEAVSDDAYERREWRRRLDAARRALQGELY